MLRDSYTVFRREEKWNGVTPTNFDSFDMERLQYFVSLKIESWSSNIVLITHVVQNNVIFDRLQISRNFSCWTIPRTLF